MVIWLYLPMLYSTIPKMDLRDWSIAPPLKEKRKEERKKEGERKKKRKKKGRRKEKHAPT